MFYRAKQFFSALFAHLNEMDKQYIADKLDKNEQRLFYRMDVADQRHCLNVAYTIRDLLKNHSGKVDERVMIKAALLHDTGKLFGRFKLWHRVAIVLLQRISVSYWDKLSSRGKKMRLGSILHSFYVYRQHHLLGAELLDGIMADKMLIELVRLHHQKNPSNDLMELQLLIKADELN